MARPLSSSSGNLGAVILQTPRRYLLSALGQATWMLFPPQLDLAEQAERLKAWAPVRPPARLAGAGNQAEAEADPFTRQGSFP